MEEKTLTFDEKLSKLLELAKSKKNVLEEKDIHDAFAGEELTPEKLDRIYDFLDKKHVDVLKMSNDDDMDPDLFTEDEIRTRRMRSIWNISTSQFRKESAWMTLSGCI